MAYSPEIQRLHMAALQKFREGELNEYARLNEQLFHLSADNGGEGDIDFAYEALYGFSRYGSLDQAYGVLAAITKHSQINAFLGRLMGESDLAALRSDSRWEKVLEELTCTENSGAAVQQALAEGVRARLEEILHEDQQVRWELMQMVSRGDFNGAQALQFKEAMETKNKEHLRYITTLLDKYSWPSPEQVGTKGTEALFLVLQHADVATQEKYMPNVKEAVDKGYLQKSQWAIFVDKVAINRGQLQTYGSQVFRNETGIFVIMPTEDIESLDERREQVGLPPIGQYLDLINKQIRTG